MIAYCLQLQICHAYSKRKQLIIDLIDRLFRVGELRLRIGNLESFRRSVGYFGLGLTIWHALDHMKDLL